MQLGAASSAADALAMPADLALALIGTKLKAIGEAAKAVAASQRPRESGRGRIRSMEDLAAFLRRPPMPLGK